MNTITTQRLDRDACVRALADFWRDETRVEETREGLAVALPLLYPDGWQVVVSLEQLTAHDVRISDKGRTLGKLAELGLNWDRSAKSNQSLLDERLRTFELQRDGFEITGTARLPLQGLDWDDTALSIGRSVCDVFCPYYAANAFEDALGRVA